MNKSTLIAILVFVGLAVAVATTMKEKPQRGVTHLSLEHVDVEAVDRLLIGDDDDGIDLVRAEPGWMLDGKLADRAVVEGVLESVSGVRSSDLASRNPDRYAELEVDEENGARLRLFAGGAQVADLVVGSAASGGSYVRVGGDVFVAPRIYRASLTRGRVGWLERKLFFDEADAIERVEVSLRAGDSYSLVKEDGGWQLEDPSILPPGHRFDSDAAAGLVRSLLSMRADDVLDDDPSAAGLLNQGSDQLRFGVKGVAELRRLDLGDSEDGTVVARSSARKPLVTLQESVAARVRKTLADLRDLGIVELDPGRATKLSIESSEGTLTLDKGEDGWAISESTAALPDGFELDPSAVMRRLNALRRTTAFQEAAPSQALEATAAAQKITVGLDDASDVVVAFGAESEVDGKTVVATLGNIDARTYWIEKSTRDRLLGGAESFQRVAPALPANGLGGIDPEALKNLPPEVRDSLLKQMAEQSQRQAAMQRAMEAAGK